MSSMATGYFILCAQMVGCRMIFSRLAAIHLIQTNPASHELSGCVAMETRCKMFWTDRCFIIIS
jgi:hypothetical protein